MKQRGAIDALVLIAVGMILALGWGFIYFICRGWL